ncbi:16S rRNA m(4)C1402 methyltransferase [Azospirillaceae bacterium]
MSGVEFLNSEHSVSEHPLDQMSHDRVHAPVLLQEVVDALTGTLETPVEEDRVCVDGTFGAGGYSLALLKAGVRRVWAFDRDPEAVARGRVLAAQFPGRLEVIESAFDVMDEALAMRGVGVVDGIALDLGVSSAQLDQAERGFSFRFDGPLDMRMNLQGATAADMVNSLSEEELADALFYLGEERHARRVARAIVAARREAPIERTWRLSEIVRSAVPRSRDGIDPATRTFQGLRLLVNDELGQLRRVLDAAERLLRPGGRLAVVSFHSLEDRIVKTFFRERAGQVAEPSRHCPAPLRPLRQEPTLRLIHRRPITPSAAETAANPRARSARLRVAERTAAVRTAAVVGANVLWAADGLLPNEETE